MVEKSRRLSSPPPAATSWKPVVEDDGEQGYWIDEVGVWMLALPRFEEMTRFKGDPELSSFRTWLYEWREQVLRANPPPAT